MPVLIVFVSPSLHQNDSLHCGSCCGVPLAGLAPGKSQRIRVEGGVAGTRCCPKSRSRHLFSRIGQNLAQTIPNGEIFTFS
jgi:hypothetical protein